MLITVNSRFAMVLRKIFALEGKFSLFYKGYYLFYSTLIQANSAFVSKSCTLTSMILWTYHTLYLQVGLGTTYPLPLPHPSPPFTITIARDILSNKKLIIYGLFVSRCFDRFPYTVRLSVFLLFLEVQLCCYFPRLVTYLIYAF